MNLQQAIGSKFNLSRYALEDKWQSIRCPLHEDSSASAGINFSLNMFSCQAGCGNFPLHKLAEKLNLVYDNNENEELDINWIYEMEEVKDVPLKKQVKELSEFLSDRKLEYATLTKWNGTFINDKEDKDHLYGFLKFSIGKGYAARKILPSALGERFKNSKGNKSLLGKENLKLPESREQAILVEGITDFLTMWQLGYKNVTCSMGAKLSKEQAYLLRGRIVFIIYDRDFAGYEGSKQASELLREYGSTPIIVELPDNGTDKNDINDMYCKDELALREFLKLSLTRHSTYDNDYIKTKRIKRECSRLYRTGLATLDGVFNGGFGNGVYAFAGEEKIGKSTSVTTMVHSFVQQNARTFLASYELSKDQIWARLAARYSSHSWQDLELDFSKINDEWCDELEQLSNNFKVEVGPTMDEIYAARNSFDIFIIDYIQRMPPIKTGMDERTAITQNNRALSEMMAKYNKTIVMISSMPRSSYGNSNPMYKGTGDIEYTVQGGIRMSKVAPNVISLRVVQNTRGEADKTIHCEVNWRKQLLREMSEDEFFKSLGV